MLRGAGPGGCSVEQPAVCLDDPIADHPPAIQSFDGGASADIVAPAANRDFETLVPRKTHGVRDIGAAEALRDKRRPLVD